MHINTHTYKHTFTDTHNAQTHKRTNVEKRRHTDVQTRKYFNILSNSTQRRPFHNSKPFNAVQAIAKF